MSKHKKWLVFEGLVAQIQRALAPQANITPNEKILGKRSKVFRQIDITVRQNVGQYDILIAIDCKDYTTPVDVKDVEQFIGLVEDVGANKGAIVSASGFTQTAKTRAADAGIDVYRLVDAEKHDWQSYVSIPVLLDKRRIKAFNFRFTGPLSIQLQDTRTIILFNRSGESKGTVLSLLAKKWNSKLLPTEPGEHRDIKLVDGVTFIKTGQQLCQVEVTANIRVEQGLYFGQLPLAEVKGFEDQISGRLITKGFETEYLDFEKVERNWQRVKSREQLAVEPVFILTYCDRYLCDNLKACCSN